MDRLLALVLVSLSLAFVTVFLAVALLRLTFPFELEWMGGAFVDHVLRVRDGQPLYVEPTIDFVPFLYTPLFFYASAALTEVVGEGFVALRLTSLTASVATLVLTVWLLRRYTDRWLPAAVACGLFGASYHLVGSWFDLARVDSLFLFFAAGATGLLWLGRGVGTAVVAGLVMTCAYLTKQTALVIGTALAVAALFGDGAHPVRRALAFATAFGGSLAASILVLDGVYDGWFSYYTWTLPNRHEYTFEALTDFWLVDLRPLWPGFALALVWVIVRAHAGEWRRLLFHGAWCGGFVTASWLSRMHVGGAENVLMPALLAISWIAGVAFGDLARLELREVRPWLPRVAAVAVVFQLGSLVYDPRPYVPREADRVVQQELVREIQSTPGDVFIPLHGYLARLAGKRPTAHALAVLDVLRGGDDQFAKELGEAFWSHSHREECKLVVLDEPGYGDFAELVKTGYVVGRVMVEDDPDLMMPVAGLKTRPSMVFRASRN